MNRQRVECIFYTGKWSLQENTYKCLIREKIIAEDSELEIIGIHEDEKTNQDVEAISFDYCTVTKVPQGLMKIFPNLKFLQIHESKLKSIEQNDLREYKDLKDLTVRGNEIKFLTGDLFSGMNNLEEITFNNNKIEVIEPNLLDGFEKLKIVDFRGNVCIDKRFNSINNIGNATLQEIKDEIREKYFNSPWKKFFDRRYELTNGFCDDLKKIVKNENFKDFSVQVFDEEFKVHKLLLVARSPVFKEMIENNIDAECLNLVDVPKEIFREILNFIYIDEFPKFDDINFIHLYIAAGRLKIENLKNFAAEKLIYQVNAENALEMLTLANKYENENLRQKSFKLIKDELNGEVAEIADNLAMKPEKLKKIVEFKREKEKMMKDMELKLEMILKED